MGNTARILMYNTWESMHRSSLKPHIAYNEFCDNSLDNEATKVSFIYKEYSVIIKDNGTGIKNTVEDVERVLAMSKSSKKENQNAIGHFGIGMKEAIMKLGKGCTIISTAPGCKTIMIDLPYKDMDFSQPVDWKIFNNGNNEQGTEIEIFFDDDYIPPPPNHHSFKYFDRYIKSDKLEITLNGIIQSGSPEPKFKSFRNYGKTSFQGYDFEFTMGELEDSCKLPYGFYVYSNESLRYFLAGQKNLDENTEAIEGLYVLISLINTKKKWHFEKNKENISNISIISKSWEFRNALEYWKTKIKRIKNTDLAKELTNNFAPYESIIPGGYNAKRPNKGDNNGIIPPKGTERKAKFATEVEPNINGRYTPKGKNKFSAFNVAFFPFSNNDKEKYGNTDKGNDKKSVNLNSSNALIKQCLTNKSIPSKTILRHLIGLILNADEIKGNELNMDLMGIIFHRHKYFLDTETQE